MELFYNSSQYNYLTTVLTRSLISSQLILISNRVIAIFKRCMIFNSALFELVMLSKSSFVYFLNGLFYLILRK